MQSGPDQFKDWMRRRGFTQADAARYLGFTQPQITQWLAAGTGRRNPGLDTAIKIERLTGIPVEAWAASELDESETAPAPTTRKRSA